ncbi:hypothetical protein P170DRAFT_315312, partial [Aspergillus steynii IBT 23096]
RQRRTHNKSRHGCRNCKLRRVKCDETKPRCAKCRSYGVLCDYAGPSLDLQLSQELKMPALVATDGSSSMELDAEGLARLMRFECRTIETAINVSSKPLVQRAMGSPSLMHAILAFTEVHDRYLQRRAPTTPGTRELYHASLGSSLFIRQLSSPIQADDRDTVWATATFLGILAFTSVPAMTVEDCWPLKEADLTWLCLSQTKMALWNLTNPMRSDSLFHDMSDEYIIMYSPRLNGWDGILSDVYQLCGLGPSSLHPHVDTNPYREAFKFLQGLYPESVETIVSRSHALVFISRMQPCFVKLLRARDPVALVLLALWYERAGKLIWWVRYRTLVEGPAICTYL